MLDYNQTQRLIDFASKADTFQQVEAFMLETFEVPNGPQSVGAYRTALETHPQLLDSRDPATLEHLLGFMTRRDLDNSPLKNKLTPQQQETLKVQPTYSMLSKILADTPPSQRPSKTLRSDAFGNDSQRRGDLSRCGCGFRKSWQGSNFRLAGR